jgi:CP family cyanate transporter-like MFS transporter
MPRTVIFCALLVGVAMWAPIFCVPPIEPLIKEQLLLTHTQTSLLLSAPVLMLVAIAIPAGLVSDRIGIRKAVGIGLIIMAVGALLRGTASDFTSLLGFTFIYGFGFGWTFPNLPKLVSTYVGKEKASVAMGIVNSGFPIGTALGLALTIPVVLPIAGTFRGVFLIWSIPALIAVAFWWALIREPQARFSHIEKLQTPVTGFRGVLLNRQLWLVGGLLFLHQFFSWNWLGWAPVMMILKGASPGLAGLIAAVTIWAVLPTFLLVPRLSHRIGLRKPFLWVSSMVLAITSWAAQYVTVSTSWCLMALAGVAMGTRFTMLLTLPIEMMHEREIGITSGMVLSVGFAGGVIGPLVGGRILDTTQSLDLSLMILVITSLVAVFIATRIQETGPGRKA